VRGFDVYVRLPRPLIAPVPLRVRFSDGENEARSPWYLLMPRADLSMLDTYVGTSPAMVDLARRHLRGRGVEFGALHAPLPVDDDVATVVYADRLTRDEALETFFEMREHFGGDFVDPEIIVDLDTSDLTELAGEDFDFFIANGVVEHLANPLLFLERLEGLMRPGSLLFVAVPDRDFTFDARRRCTQLEHLVVEHRDGVTTIDDDHVADMARRSPPYYHPRGEAERAVLYDFHRARSLHAHVWTEASFDRMLEHARDQLGLRLEVVERVGPSEGRGDIVYVLRRVA
jgi:SAM-dependent methyltransferase